jgi:hypothetical protein
MNAIDIIRAYLKEHGYDGLCSGEDHCGCDVEDMCPGGYDVCDLSHCVPAKKKIATVEDIDDESEFEIGDEIFVEEEEKAERG